MRKLGSLLSSAARTEILRALYYQAEPIGLRPLARLAGILPRSAQVALAALLDERLVCRTRDAAGALYVLNRTHPDAELLEAIVTAATRAVISSRCRTLGARASRMLPFIREAEFLVARAKRVSHVA